MIWVRGTRRTRGRAGRPIYTSDATAIGSRNVVTLNRNHDLTSGLIIICERKASLVYEKIFTEIVFNKRSRFFLSIEINRIEF